MKVRPKTFQCLLDLLENRGGILRVNNHSLHVVSIPYLGLHGKSSKHPTSIGATAMSLIEELERIAAALKEEAAKSDRECESFEFAARMVNAAKTTLKSIEFRQAA